MAKAAHQASKPAQQASKSAQQASKSAQQASTRTVVLLRPEEKRRLESLAASEHISTGELMRRSLHAYERQTSASEQEVLNTLLSEMNAALDRSLESIRLTRSEIRENLDQIRQMREARA